MWLYEVPKEVPQEALRNKDKAFKRFYDNLKAKRKRRCKNTYSYPRFRSKKHGLGSFTLRNCIHIRPGYIKIPRFGWVKLKERGYLPCTEDQDGKATGVKIVSITASERAGRWFVSVHVEPEVDEHKVLKSQPLATTGEVVPHIVTDYTAESQGRVIGIDYGLTTFGTGVQDDGAVVEIVSPKQLRSLLRQLNRLSRQHCRRVKGGKNRVQTGMALG